MDNQTVIALGNFDGVHKGHQKLIQTAKDYAKQNGMRSAVFTFINDIDLVIKGISNGTIFTGDEKLSLIGETNVDSIIATVFDNNFLNQTPLEFLEYLNNYNVSTYVCGSDYKFGKNASGNIETLKQYAIKNNKQVIVVDNVNYNDNKISATRIKKALQEGDIKSANQMLVKPYFITGIVDNGRSVGKNLGYPTANLLIDSQKMPIKQGVYAGKVQIDNEIYNCAVNYGTRPTFCVNEFAIEVHVIGTYKDLYGKTLKVTLVNYLRPIKTFENKEQLIKQIEQDIKRCI